MKGVKGDFKYKFNSNIHKLSLETILQQMSEIRSLGEAEKNCINRYKLILPEKKYSKSLISNNLVGQTYNNFFLYLFNEVIQM